MTWEEACPHRAALDLLGRHADRVPELFGRLVVADLFYADGPNLYAAAAEDPDLVVARIPEAERRFMAEIPLAASGPWQPGAQEAIRTGLAAADARKAGV